MSVEVLCYYERSWLPLVWSKEWHRVVYSISNIIN